MAYRITSGATWTSNNCSSATIPQVSEPKKPPDSGFQWFDSSPPQALRDWGMAPVSCRKTGPTVLQAVDMYLHFQRILRGHHKEGLGQRSTFSPIVTRRSCMASSMAD